MSKQPKKRLCWNCEGSVGATTENCPFCGVSVIPASLDGPGGFSPPYRMGSTQENAVPKSPFAAAESEEKEDSDMDQENHTEKSREEDVPEEFKPMLVATIMLLTGSVFFLFGIVLALFSQNGVFTLQWNGNIWFIYSALSLPLLYFGWKSLSRL